MHSINLENELKPRDLLMEFGLDATTRDNETIVYAILLLVKEVRELKEMIKK